MYMTWMLYWYICRKVHWSHLDSVVTSFLKMATNGLWLVIMLTLQEKRIVMEFFLNKICASISHYLVWSDIILSVIKQKWHLYLRKMPWNLQIAKNPPYAIIIIMPRHYIVCWGLLSQCYCIWFLNWIAFFWWRLLGIVLYCLELYCMGSSFLLLSVVTLLLVLHQMHLSLKYNDSFLLYNFMHTSLLMILFLCCTAPCVFGSMSLLSLALSPILQLYVCECSTHLASMCISVKQS